MRSATERFVLVPALLAALSGPGRARGQELPSEVELSAPCAPEVTEDRRALLRHGAQTGIWFQGDVARCMASRLALLPAYARYVALLEQRLMLSDERDGLRSRALELAAQEADAAEGALEAALERARQAEEQRNAWFRHPGLWAAVGVALTVVIEAVAVAAFGEVG